MVTALSGAAGLGYEIVWTRILALGLGHETPAILSVLAAFFGGSALGSILLDKKISQSRFPSRWYAILETFIFLWAVVLAFTLPFVSSITAQLIGSAPSPALQWILSFTLPYCFLLPATFAMGGTLIAIERVLSRISGSVDVVATYAANTFGAVAGVVLVSYVFLPNAGFFTTLLILSSVSAACSMIAFFLKLPFNTNASNSQQGLNYPVLTALFITGFLGIAYEILIIRALSQVLENTVYSFAAILAVYLSGTFIGATIRQSNRLKLDNYGILSFLIISTLSGTVFLRAVPVIFEYLTHAGQGSSLLMIVFEHLTTLCVLILPTIAMGYSFSHLSCQVRGKNGGFGLALAVNTFGGMLAPVCIGIIMLPFMGLKPLLITCITGYTTIVLIPGFSSGNTGRKGILIIGAVSLLLGILLTPSTSVFTRLQKGDSIIKVLDGVMATCTVVGDNSGGRHLLFNSRFQEGGTSSPAADCREAAIPLLLHNNPQNVLFLGIGAGVTFATAGWFPDIRADGIEIVPEMRELVKYFIGNVPQNCTFITADARRYVSVCSKKYDVIVADLYHPARDGAGFLYTREHFDAVGRLLLPNGLFCQWLPIYQMDEVTLKTIMRTFNKVFPYALVSLANYSVEMPIIGLFGSMQPLSPDPLRIEKATKADSLMKNRLESIKLYSSISLMGGIIGSNDFIKKYSGDGYVNTDDFPAVLFQAPEFVYGKQNRTASEPIKRMIELPFVNSQQFIYSSDSLQAHEFTIRINRYREARDRFIHMGIKIAESHKSPSSDELTDSLLSFLQVSGDFESAYNPLLGIAMQTYRTDSAKSLTLLAKLDTLSPMRAEARMLLRKFSERSTTPGEDAVGSEINRK